MSVVIVGVIRRKPVLTHASIVCEGMLAAVNSVKDTEAAEVMASEREFHSVIVRGANDFWYSI